MRMINGWIFAVYSKVLAARCGEHPTQFSKTIPVLILAAISMAISGNAQPASASAGSAGAETVAPTEAINYRVTERGPSHRKIEWTTQTTAPNGRTVTEDHSVTELATGLHYRHGNQWLETKEEFELLPGWAVARRGPHKLSIAYNLNLSGAVAIELPNGQVVRSHVVGLAYVDKGSGQSVVLGYIKDCAGKLVATNQVLYEDSFTNFKADVRYTYTKAGVAQDIVLREKLSDPAELGLNPETSRLAVFTEFVGGPNPEIRNVPSLLADQAVPAGRDAGGMETDVTLQFGEMFMGRGKAFTLGEKGDRPSLGRQVPVLKKWVELNGRKYLFEEVPFSKIQADLDALPRQSSMKQKKWTRTAFAKLQFPKLPGRRPEAKQFEVAAISPRAGYVLDYELLGASLTNFTFRADETYYVSGTVNLYGTNVFEGGAVLKYNPTNYHALNLNGGTVVCKTGPYRPVIFTSQHDDSAGQILPGSSGSPSGIHIDSYYLVLSGITNANLNNLRMTYGNCSFTTYSCSNIVVSDVQILHSDYPFYPVNTKDLKIRNALVFQTGDTVFWSDTSTVSVEHMTVNQSGWFGFNASWSGNSLAVTNSLIVGASSLGDIPLTTNCVAVLSSSNGVFQTVGGGSHYLATNSPYRDAGTTGISPVLLADLTKKTTCPPLVYSNSIISNTLILTPLPIRDTNAPDVGYHYEPLDAVFGGCVLSTNMTIASGTAVAWFEEYGGADVSGQPYGVVLNDGAQVEFQGSASAPARFLRFNVVQEAIGAWSDRGWMSGMVFNGSGGAPRPRISAQFTKWHGTMGYAGVFRDNWNYGDACIAHSEFLASTIATYGASTYFTNCLFDRAGLALYGDADATSITFLNSTFREGGMIMKRYSGGSPSFWRVENCAFDGMNITTYDELNANTNSTYMDYNAFNPSNTNWISHPFSWWGAPKTNVLEVAGPHDMTVTNYNWQAGALGDFYLPVGSNLTNSGSTNANLIGLYHFTTTTNQVKETNSMVDIGYHYVALDDKGFPFDSDFDDFADYIEDANGNGTGADDAQSWVLNRFNGLSASKRLQVHTPLK